MLWFPWTEVLSFWDVGTTTLVNFLRTDVTLRQSRFRWQRSESNFYRLFCPWWDWEELYFRRRLYCVCGISYFMKNISTGAILNRRTILTAANCLDPYMTDATNLRIWALGREGDHITPYRYRVWRVTRVFPRSLNPEHQHGPWAYHSPRHDVAIIHTLDQIYIFSRISPRYHYACKAYLPSQRLFKISELHMVGSGFEYLEHLYENYKIFFAKIDTNLIRDCSMIIPKWWGKFICITNTRAFPGVQNGGGLYDTHNLVGIGCFEIRYNEDRVFVFTDLRYYISTISKLASIQPGEYYEYAYPQWSINYSWFWGYSNKNSPVILSKNIEDDLYPLGK